MLILKKISVLSGFVGAAVIIMTLFTGCMFGSQNKIEKLNDAIRTEDYAAAEEMISNMTADDINKGARKASYHPLTLACFYGQEQIVSMLLEKGADVNFCEDETGDTPVITALDSDSAARYRIANMLIEAGADINAVNKSGFSPLTLVLKHKAKDTDEMDAERLELFKVLYEEADVENCLAKEPMQPRNAVELAVNMDSPDAVDWLISEKGFAPSDIPALDGSMLHYSYNLDEQGHLTNGLRMIEYIVRNGLEDINTLNPDGKTILMTAAEAEDAEACELFLSLGADKTIRDNAGKTAYDYAAKYNSGELDKLLR